MTYSIFLSDEKPSNAPYDVFFSGLSLKNNQIEAWRHPEGWFENNLFLIDFKCFAWMDVTVTSQPNNSKRGKMSARRLRCSSDKATTHSVDNVVEVSSPSYGNDSKVHYTSNKKQQLHHPNPNHSMNNDVLLDMIVPTKRPLNTSDEPIDDPNTLLPSASPVTCNCKKSKCLKLYCQCFAVLQYCNNCNCKDCSNHAGAEKVCEYCLFSCVR